MFTRSIMSLAFSTEKQVAISAVRRACSLTASVFNRLVKSETSTKDDKSPVTVADYSAQAVISTMLAHAFPADSIVGEEDSSDLRAESGSDLRSRVIELANEALTADLALGDNAEWGIGPGQAKSPEQLLDAIDRGNFAGGRHGRMWTIDPIDGTKGFLRGEQYAVCVSLIVDAQVQLGVIGCPNLPVDPSKPDGDKGSLFVAVRGQGAHQMTLSGADPAPLTIPTFSLDELNLLESVESAHASHSFHDNVASNLGLTKPPTRMDSQAKYCALARGDGGVYIRMLTNSSYREKIWDHAPGVVLVEEAGGVISDFRGQPLDFGAGRTLGENLGILATGKKVYPSVLEAVKKVLSEQKSNV
ncbi:hypothetical protein HGRIS_010577 [Hohenbuehelia grisea]|uniref:3'(2'),5'-bisphosphate nucleotidase n=1 Tax=Hohenbuehelia grisea TaxID=104357 RepID=A0ABR3IXE4_9AGAR